VSCWPTYCLGALNDGAGFPESASSGKLHLYSMGKCEALLGIDRGRLRFLAQHAGSYYRPFPKRDRPRPFQKKPKPPRKRPRIIDNPTGELKALQTRINRSLLKPVVFPAYLCGGVPGKTVLDNVLLHFGAPVVVRVDIKSFFRRITNLQVYRVWRETLDCSPKVAALLTKLTTFERHLPQGAPTSTLLANLVLFSIDRPIRDACQRHGVIYSTWVDDLAFSGAEARAVIGTAVTALRDAGFSVSHSKLVTMGPGSRQVLNGVLMGRFPSVLRERLSRLRSGVHKLSVGEVPAADVQVYIRRLRGGIAHVASIAPLKAKRLSRDLERAAEPFVG
jgi:RNA-directed DNA polymerase